ncbi:MAG: transcriptional repressor NrdR [Dehalococcoidia bacterium]|nr:transcriptional repressor NrdR [Dehalococcoidia bacterium]
MKCPYCGHAASKVLDSRTAEAGIRRRRRCEDCGERFTTYEQVQRAVVMVVKKDGRREEFQREKLLGGLRTAARKRPLPTGAVDALVEDIEQHLMAGGRSEVPSRVIGEMAITRLKQLDPIAYIRFASVYHQFVSLEQMLEELHRIALSGGLPAPEQARLFRDEFAEIFEGGAVALDEDGELPAAFDMTRGEAAEAPTGDRPAARDDLEDSEAAREPISINSARGFSYQPI